MKRHVCQNAMRILVVLALLAFLIPVGCRKAIKSETPTITQPKSEHIERVKKWYNEVWRNSTNSRVSTWDHDTSFIINNYANLVLDWRFTRVVQQSGATYTEVLAYVADTLEFKIGTTDTTQLANLLFDDNYRDLSQSKVVWLLKEAPNESPIVEIVTFIGDYQYVINNQVRFNTGVNYFDLADYTGLVLYHDRNGLLIRSFQYDRGNVINTIRCGVEGGLDPDPGNRVHFDICWEILTWERECTTFYSDEGIGDKVCGDWFLIGSRLVGNCEAPVGTVGSGGSENYAPMHEDGMDCVTFTFTRTSNNWQEAGVVNSKVKIAWLGAAPGGTTHYINATISGPIIIGLPRFNQYGENISEGKAAEIAAWACTEAVALTNALLRAKATIPSNLEVETVFRRQVQNLLLIHGGTADRTGSGSAGIITKNAKYRFLGNGDCD